MATPITTLFPLWARAQAAADRTGDITEESALVERILAERAEDARDLAMKLVAVCGWDDSASFCGLRAATVLAEARSLAVQP